MCDGAFLGIVHHLADYHRKEIALSAKTRIHRPTTSTPRNLKRERMVHQSTNIVTVIHPETKMPVNMKAKGVTYRRPA